MQAGLPPVDPEVVKDAVLALEGTVLSDFHFPLPGDLKDISKAAALVSGTIEDRLPELLNRVRNTTWDEAGTYLGFEFRKAPIGFPDCLLVERRNPGNVIFEIEAKSWYVLLADALTARFLTHADAITPGTLVVLVAWLLDGAMNGSPKLLRIYIDDAQRLARTRDEAWERIDENHRVLPPANPPDTPLNLRQTQARGEVRKPGGEWRADADNYGKLDRLYDEHLRQFKGDVLSLPVAAKPLRDWRQFVKGK